MSDILENEELFFVLSDSGELELLLSSPKPYGNVAYADPKNGKYPVDSAKHVRAAWSYINMPRNAKKYAADKLAKVKAAIKRAAKKFGVEISSTKELSASGMGGPVKMYVASPARPKITPPDNDSTHFYKAGRFLSYFPQVNENGIAFEREKVQPVLDRLIATTFDIQHIKPGYAVPDPQKLRNTTCGAILSYEEDEEGIDICVKGEIEVARALGITPEDLAPHGEYGMFSQECEQHPLEAEWIIVDRNDPTKILSRIDYMEGMAMGLRRSAVGKDGQWHYCFHDGNPVYLSPSPMGFVGVAAVETPADPSARIYSSRILSALYPGMDEDYPAPDMIASDVGPIGADKSAYADDFSLNPDLLMPSSVNFDNDDDDHPSYPNDLFAAVYETPDPEKIGHTVTKRAFRVKKPGGDFDRSRLIAAYQAMCGMRGNTMRANDLPPQVHAHAMAYIRQGLNATNKSKETSSKTMAELNPADAAALQAKYDEIKGHEEAKDREIATLKSQIADLTDNHKNELSSRENRIQELETEVNAFKTEKLVASRLSELEAIHPFGDDERENIVKELASVSDDRFENYKLRRELARRDAQHAADAAKQRELASRNAGAGAPYIPKVDGQEPPKTKLTDGVYAI